MFRRILNKDPTFGDLCVVINNAGIGNTAHVESADIKHWTQILDINLRAVMHICHYCVPYLKNSISNRDNKNNKNNKIGIGIINVGSIASTKLISRPAISMYQATKFAIR